jgi:hypothetical protein
MGETTSGAGMVDVSGVPDLSWLSDLSGMSVWMGETTRGAGITTWAQYWVALGGEGFVGVERIGVVAGPAGHQCVVSETSAFDERVHVLLWEVGG